VHPLHAFTPAFALEHVTLCLSAEQVQVPPLHCPHGVFGWFVSTEHPPQAFAVPGSLHTTLSVPEHCQVPPPHWPQGVVGAWASIEHPPHGLRAPASPQTTASVPEQVQLPPPH
jgi:hypothetical protein